jgi:hypothetical protein
MVNVVFDPYRGFTAAWPGGPPVEVVIAANQAATTQAQPVYRPVCHLCHICRGYRVSNAYDLCPACAQVDAKRHSVEHRLELLSALLRDGQFAAKTATKYGLSKDYALNCSTKRLFRERQATILSGWLIWDHSRFDADAGLMGIQRDDYLVLAEKGVLYHITGRKLYNPDYTSAQERLEAGLIAAGDSYTLEQLEAYTAALADFIAKLAQ